MFRCIQRILPQENRRKRVEVGSIGNDVVEAVRNGMLNLRNMVDGLCLSRDGLSVASTENERKVPVYAVHGKSPSERHSHVAMIFETGEDGSNQSALRRLAFAYMRGHLFVELRSKRQLGYEVETSTFRGHNGILIKVKSMSKPAYVVHCIWECLDIIHGRIENMSQRSLDVYKHSAEVGMADVSGSALEQAKKAWDTLMGTVERKTDDDSTAHKSERDDESSNLENKVQS